MRQVLETDGRVWLRNALNEQDLELLENNSNYTNKVGRRVQWSQSLCEAIGTSSKLGELAQCLMLEAKPVRLVSFNKTLDVNWALPWHQDRVIAVTDKADIEGYNNWTQKTGIWHCEPPIKILKKMIFARVHLDDSDANNGCLELSLGSHKFGIVKSDNIKSIVEKLPAETCVAKRGDVLFVKALTLHRSKLSTSALQRRAFRVDYANMDLEPPLKWAY